MLLITRKLSTRTYIIPEQARKLDRDLTFPALSFTQGLQDV